MDDNHIRIGISSCLLGNNVRYDGGHQHDRFITGTLGKFVEFVPVCPEVECGLPVPREAMRLVGSPENPRLVTRKTRVDHTDKMQNWAREKVLELEKENLCGFIFKSKSPSSGMERVRVYHPEKNSVSGTGAGMFARALMEHLPLLPVEEDGRLHDILLRETFIEQIFVYKRWRDLVSSSFSLGNLVNFHTDHKLLLMAHNINHYNTLGNLVAHAKQYDLKELAEKYETTLMKALRVKTSVKRHTNVLNHMMGYFKKSLSRDEKQELMEIIEAFHSGYYPLIVPITLINHYVRKYGQSYLSRQYYLNPHPMELKLRNHA